MPDNQLIELYCQTNEKKYIGHLFERYTHLVFGVCMKYMKNEDNSKDAVMQIFEQLFEKLKKHRIDNFPAWLHSVARNHCLMKLRKTKKEYETDNIPDIIVENQTELHLIDEDIETKLQNAINQLDEKQQTCISLFYLDEKSYKEVEQITGFSYKEVKSYIQNGKRKLKIILSENE